MKNRDEYEKAKYLNVMLVNLHETRMAVVHLNEHIPPSRRVVRVKLTPEQAEQITLRCVGETSGKPVYEEYGPIWLSDEIQE